MCRFVCTNSQCNASSRLGIIFYSLKRSVRLHAANASVSERKVSTVIHALSFDFRRDFLICFISLHVPHTFLFVVFFPTKTLQNNVALQSEGIENCFSTIYLVL